MLPQGKIDRAYDQKMKEVHQEREKRVEFEKLNSKIIETSQHNNETQRFLADGLNHKLVSVMMFSFSSVNMYLCVLLLLSILFSHILYFNAWLISL